MNYDLKFNGSTDHFNFFRFCLVFVLIERPYLRISSDISKNLFLLQDQCGLSCGYLEGVRKLSGGCLAGVLWLSGRCLNGV